MIRFLPLVLFGIILAHRDHDVSHGIKKGTLDHENFGRLAQDIDHITEHLKEKINVKKDLTPEELEFYYFMEHDFNNDSRLDGLEILSAIKHSDFANELRVETKNLTPQEVKKAYEKEIGYYADIIDEILREDDFNNDGYLSYIEYALARKRDEKDEAKKKSNSNKDP